MLPKTKKQEKKHRKKKRDLEISMVAEELDNLVPKRKKGILTILEFGCGDGFQIPVLEKFGDVTAMDVYLSKEVSKMPDVNFIQASITTTLFGNGKFDIIFSNHVLEHLQRLKKTFKELKRIGKKNCIYLPFQQEYG